MINNVLHDCFLYKITLFTLLCYALTKLICLLCCPHISRYVQYQLAPFIAFEASFEVIIMLIIKDNFINVTLLVFERDFPLLRV